MDDRQLTGMQLRNTADIRSFLDLVLFKAAAELRAERERTYLGLLWWLLEPLIFMLVIFLVFRVFMQRGGSDFVPRLLIGLVLWQWFKSAISHSAASVLNGKSLMREVSVSPLLFPLSTVLADSAKALIVLLLLVCGLLLFGYIPGWSLIQLPVVLLAEFVLIIGCSLLVSAVVPFVPDLRFVVEPMLQALFFLSAVFYGINEISPSLRGLILLNPIARIITEARAILITAEPADLAALIGWILFGMALSTLGVWNLGRMARHYAKLPT